MPLKPSSQPRIAFGVNAPFKSPLRPKNATTELITSTRSAILLAESPAESTCTPTYVVSNLSAHSEFSSPRLPSSENEPVNECDLDESIRALKCRICKLRGLESFDERDLEVELKKWRELLHEYNDAKDACLHVFGQVSQLKMTTVKDLYRKYNLEINL